MPCFKPYSGIRLVRKFLAASCSSSLENSGNSIASWIGNESAAADLFHCLMNRRRIRWAIAFVAVVTVAVAVVVVAATKLARTWRAAWKITVNREKQRPHTHTFTGELTRIDKLVVGFVFHRKGVWKLISGAQEPYLSSTAHSWVQRNMTAWAEIQSESIRNMFGNTFV